MGNKIVWFRNNLRVRDNEPLLNAVDAAKKSGGSVIPLYVIDPFWFGETSFGFPMQGKFRRKFLFQSLRDLDNNLRELGAQLWIAEGTSEEALSNAATVSEADCIFAQQEYASYEKSIARRVSKSARDSGLDFEITPGNTLYAEEQLPFSLSDIPETFTKFRKVVESKCEILDSLDAPISIPANKKLAARLEASGAFMELGKADAFQALDVDFDARGCLQFDGGESAAHQRLDSYFWKDDLLRNYKLTRNEMLGSDYSSKFSPWLAHGCISPRQIAAEIQRYEIERVANESTYWLLFELLWRDYFAFMVAKHGAKVFRVGGLRQQKLQWNQNSELFDIWCNGQTGFPLIDANMQELSSTGFMSNRGRQNVASFLTKNLGIDWRMGAQWFESLLVDYDPCSNYGNWNYSAGVGNDARGFRWFNTVKQSRDYDPDGAYVRHWLPALRNVPSDLVHEPWKMTQQQQTQFDCILGVDYPNPVVDLFKSAARNEELYQSMVPQLPPDGGRKRRTWAKQKLRPRGRGIK